jgi:ParB family chromosome partitioning protein
MTEASVIATTPEIVSSPSASPPAVQALATAQVVADIPLNRLKKSPRNVRKVEHSDADIEAFAASLRWNGLLQNLVVEPELRAGAETGYYLVTAGEGRRLGFKRLAKRKLIAKDHPVRCVIDTINDPG